MSALRGIIRDQLLQAWEILLEPMKAIKMKQVSAILHRERMQGHLVRRRPKNNNIKVKNLVLWFKKFTWMHWKLCGTRRKCEDLKEREREKKEHDDMFFALEQQRFDEKKVTGQEKNLKRKRLWSRKRLLIKWL
jgi:hypothetical protein